MTKRGDMGASLSFTVTGYYTGFRNPRILCFTVAISSRLTASPLAHGPWETKAHAISDLLIILVVQLVGQPGSQPGSQLSARSLSFKNDSSCLLAFCCAHDTARISFTVLMPSLSTTLITKLGGATTSLLRTCTADHSHPSEDSVVLIELILIPYTYPVGRQNSTCSVRSRAY